MIRSQKEIAESKHQTEHLTQSERWLLRFEAIREWFLNNQKTAIGAGVVLVAIIAGLWWWASQRSEQQTVAATYYTRILPSYTSGQYREAISGNTQKRVQGTPLYGLKYIVDNFGSTDAGDYAALTLGNAYYFVGQYDSASMAYDKASASYPIAKAAIDAGKAAVLEVKGNKTEAAKLFQSAAKRDKDNPLNADYTLSAARDLLSAGNRDGAIRLYQDLLEKYPGSQFDDAAKRALMQLNVPL